MNSISGLFKDSHACTAFAFTSEGYFLYAAPGKVHHAGVKFWKEGKI